MLALLTSLITKCGLVATLMQQATLVFAGDAMQHKAQLDASRQPDGTYDYTDCFAEIKPIVSAADFAIVNLETPLGGKPYRGYPCFSAPDSYAVALNDAGFDLFLTANNHTLDAQSKGLARTCLVLDSLKVQHTGTYINRASRDTRYPIVTEIKGFKIGFLNYTYGTNGISPDNTVIVDYIDRQQMRQDISTARNKGAEIICVAIHWGDEYRLLPNKEQKELADYLLTQGVDIILGGHPHVIQPMELVDNPQTGRKTALVYSLGNFISNMKTRDTRGGLLSQIILERDSNGQAQVKSLSYRHIFTIPPSGACTNFRVVPIETVDEAPYDKISAEYIASAESVLSRYNKNIDIWLHWMPVEKIFLKIVPEFLQIKN